MSDIWWLTSKLITSFILQHMAKSLLNTYILMSTFVSRVGRVLVQHKEDFHITFIIKEERQRNSLRIWPSSWMGQNTQFWVDFWNNRLVPPVFKLELSRNFSAVVGCKPESKRDFSQILVHRQTLPKAQRTRGLSSSFQSNLLGHITSSNTNLDQTSSSKSRPSICFKILTKHHHLD